MKWKGMWNYHQYEASWEFAPLIMWSLSSPASAERHLHVSPDRFFFGGGVKVCFPHSFLLLKEETG